MVQVTRRRHSGGGGGSASKRSKTAGATSAVDTLFDDFRGPLSADATPEDADRIGPEGVERFCEALGVSPASQTVLLLCWTMRCEHMGYFSRPEWRRGFAELHAESVAQLKKALPRLERSIYDRDAFNRFYEFGFNYCLTEPNQKILDLDTAAQMLAVVMPADCPHLAPFIEFLGVQTENKCFRRDEWLSFGRFCEEIEPDCSNYDESSSWPLIFDNYVEWRTDGANV